MKITGVKAYVVDAFAVGGTEAAELSAREGMQLNWTFVQIDTDEGITGFGKSATIPATAA